MCAGPGMDDRMEIDFQTRHGRRVADAVDVQEGKTGGEEESYV